MRMFSLRLNATNCYILHSDRTKKRYPILVLFIHFTLIYMKTFVFLLLIYYICTLNTYK